MPRKFLNKRGYTKEDLKKAVTAIRKKSMTYKEVEAEFGIPKSTVNDWATGKVNKFSRKGPPPVLTSQEEEDIKNWSNTMARRGFALTKLEVMEAVKNMLDLSGRQAKYFKNNMPGKTWWYRFMSRHPDMKVKSSRPRISKNAGKKEECRWSEPSSRQESSFVSFSSLLETSFREERLKKSELNHRSGFSDTFPVPAHSTSRNTTTQQNSFDQTGNSRSYSGLEALNSILTSDERTLYQIRFEEKCTSGDTLYMAWLLLKKEVVAEEATRQRKMKKICLNSSSSALTRRTRCKIPTRKIIKTRKRNKLPPNSSSDESIECLEERLEKTNRGRKFEKPRRVKIKVKEIERSKKSQKRRRASPAFEEEIDSSSDESIECLEKRLEKISKGSKFEIPRRVKMKVKEMERSKKNQKRRRASPAFEEEIDSSSDESIEYVQERLEKISRGREFEKPRRVKIKLKETERSKKNQKRRSASPAFEEEIDSSSDESIEYVEDRLEKPNGGREFEKPQRVKIKVSGMKRSKKNHKRRSASPTFEIEICSKCGVSFKGGKREPRWVACDKCDAWYHVKCTELSPRLTRQQVNALEWYCYDCDDGSLQ